MTYDEELAVAKQAAKKAGRIMQEYRENGFGIREPSHDGSGDAQAAEQLGVERKSSYTDMVTEADVACEEAIVDTISEAFPDDGFRTEEDTPDEDAERVWVIDPIDGTKNFVHGFPFYCTSIALKVDNAPVVGVVYNPVYDEEYTAIHGGGAYRNGSELGVSSVDTLRDALVFTRLSERHDPTRKVETPFLRDLLSTPSSFRRPGSAALNCCHVAAGTGDAYVTVSISEWDIAAGQLIIAEAGGSTRIQPSFRDGYLEFIGTNGHLQEELEELLDRHTASP